MDELLSFILNIDADDAVVDIETQSLVIVAPRNIVGFAAPSAPDYAGQFSRFQRAWGNGRREQSVAERGFSERQW